MSAFWSEGFFAAGFWADGFWDQLEDITEARPRHLGGGIFRWPTERTAIKRLDPEEDEILIPEQPIQVPAELMAAANAALRRRHARRDAEALLLLRP